MQIKIARFLSLFIFVVLTSCSAPTSLPVVTQNPPSIPTVTPTIVTTSSPTIAPTSTPEVISAENIQGITKISEESFSVDQFTNTTPYYLTPPPDNEYLYSHFRSYAKLGDDLIGILWVETFKPPIVSPMELTLRAINIGTRQELWNLPLSNGADKILIWSPDKKRIAVTDQYQVHIIDSLTGVKQVKLEKEINEVPEFLAWSPDGKFLAIGGAYKSTVRVIDSENGIDAFKIASDRNSSITALTWSPDGMLLAIGFANGQITIFNFTDKIMQELPKEKNLFVGGESISRYSDDHSVEPLISFLSGIKGIVSLSFSPDGSLLSFAESTNTSENFGLPLGTMNVWDVLENDKIFTSEQYDVYAYQPMWFIDQSTVAVFVNEIDSNVPEPKILFRDASTGAIIKELAIENSSALDFINMSLSPDGRSLDVMLSKRKIIGSEQVDRQSAIIIQHYQVK